MAETEADACRRFVTPALLAAGWDPHLQIAEQRPVTDGRVIIIGDRPHRAPAKRLDYLLRYTRDMPLAVVEAKATDVPAATGLQQAVDYGVKLGTPFAYATNGAEIIEHDFLTGVERTLEAFPSPDELWYRYRTERAISDDVAEILKLPYYQDPLRPPRYYQYLSVNRTVEAIAKGQRRILLTLATGTGKSFIAFQICYRLWQTRWNLNAEWRRPRILYLADRNVLIDQPRLGVFAPFGDALHRIDGAVVLSREMYFATYQQIARDERRPGLYREFAPDFFDLVVVDECHRGSASEESNWREILEYFSPSAQLGMTATPLRDDNRDTYEYFGAPVVEYSLAEGIDDGFLAPYQVRRVVTDVDAAGWRPTAQQMDRHGESVPDRLYETPDFDRIIVLTDRTRAIAADIVRTLEAVDPYAKTIIFCVDQEHALMMRVAIAQLSAARVAVDPDYVVRITSDEGDVGRAYLENFQDVDRKTPAIVTTSDMLTTGVDAPTVKSIVLVRSIGSMSTFKQIIGRGTRLRTDYDKWFFTIHDYTGVATEMFADPAFDGFPLDLTEETVEISIAPTPAAAREVETPAPVDPYQHLLDAEEDEQQTRKYYVDDAQVEIAAEMVYHLGADGKRLRATSFTDYVGEQVRTLVRDPEEIRGRWVDQGYRSDLVAELRARGIDPDDLLRISGENDADPFDLLCHFAFGSPVRTRRQRSASARDAAALWSKHEDRARQVLEMLLEKYEAYGVGELVLPNALEVPPLVELGNLVEIADRFGGPAQLRDAVLELQEYLYAA